MALIDTNILVRTEDLDDPDRVVCMEALRALQERDAAELCAQVLIEFWSVATRPKDSNGLGFDPVKADIAVRKLMNSLRTLPEPPDMANRWRMLASGARVSGRQVHDCRLVALMHAHGITEVITLNASDFSRFRGITTTHPKDVR